MIQQIRHLKSRLFEINLYVLGFLTILGSLLGIYFKTDILITVIFSSWTLTSAVALLSKRSRNITVQKFLTLFIILSGCIPAVLQIEASILYPYLFVVIFIQALIGYIVTDSFWGTVYNSIVVVSYSLRFFFLEDLSSVQTSVSMASQASYAISAMFILYCAYAFSLFYYIKILWAQYQIELLQQKNVLLKENDRLDKGLNRIKGIRHQFNLMDQYLHLKVLPHSKALKDKLLTFPDNKKRSFNEFNKLVGQIDGEIRNMDDSLRQINTLLHSNNFQEDAT